MEFRPKYSINPNELEPSTYEVYRRVLDVLNRYENFETCLETLVSAFSTLETSEPSSENGIWWGEEMVKMYRNLGQALRYFSINHYDKILSLMSERGIESVEELEKYFMGAEKDKEIISKAFSKL